MNFFRAALPNTISAIKTSYIAGKSSVSLYTNELTRSVLSALVELGVIASFSVIKNLNDGVKLCKINLIYINGQKPFINIKVISKGQREYFIRSYQLKSLGNSCRLILSTNLGVMTDLKSRSLGSIGGLVLLCVII